MSCEFCGKRSCKCLEEMLQEQGIKDICEGCGAEFQPENGVNYCEACTDEQVKIFEGSY